MWFLLGCETTGTAEKIVDLNTFRVGLGRFSLTITAAYVK